MRATKNVPGSKTEVTLMKSHQYGYITKTCIVITQDNMIGEISQFQTRRRRAIITQSMLRKGETVFFREELPDTLSSLNWSVINTCIHMYKEH